MNHLSLFVCSACAFAHVIAFSQSANNSPQELAPYVVTASKSAEDPLKPAAFVTVLTQEELKDAGVQTVNEALMRLGGVLGRKSLYGGNEFTMDLGGFGEAAASNMVYVIDGVPFKEGDASEIRISNISLDDVERIEIQRGGASVMYGEAAVGGVINIVTHASGLGGKVPNHAQLETGYGSYGTKDIKASSQFANDRLSVFASGAKGQSEGFRENSASHFDNASLAIQWMGDRARVGGNFSNHNVFAQTPGSLTMAQYVTNRNQADPDNLSLRTLMDSNTKHYGVFTDIDMNGLIWRTDVKRRDRSYYFVENYSGTKSSATYDTTNDVYATSLKQALPMSWGKYKYLIGVEKNHWAQSRNDASFGIYENISDGKSVFLKHEFDLAATHTQVGIGYRREDINRYSVGYKLTEYYATKKNAEAWELGVTQAIASAQSVWAKLSRNYRLANIDEISTSYGTSGLAYTNLSPQTSLDKEIGWHYLQGSSDVNFRWYQSNLKNEIAYDANVYSNINLDPTKREGVELSVRQPLSNTIDMGGFAAYRHSYFVGGTYTGNAIPLAPNRVFSVRSRWQFASAQSLGVNVSYTDTQQIGSDYTNNYPMPAYTVTDISYLYKVPKWAFQLVVRNALNKDYYGYATISNGAVALYPDMKRSVFAVLKVHLN